MPDTYS